MKLLLSRLSQIKEDKNPKKSWFRILNELFILSVKTKKIPLYYVKRFMYLKETGNYKHFLTLEEERDIYLSPKLHKLEFTSLLKNKLASSLYFEKCNVSIPDMPSYNINKLFFHEGRFEKLENTADLIRFFKKVMYESKKNSLFLKPHGELGGKGCFILNTENLESILTDIGPNLLKDSFIHQELVVQHPDINKIYEHSLNTIRFETYIDQKNKKHIRTCYIRFGADGNFVDNSSSGGIGVPVNIENGRLYEKGFRRAKGLKKAGIYTKHPSSSLLFSDFTVPFFEEAKQLVFECMKFVPDRYVGWDIAISTTGPVLIEGNGAPRLRESPHGFKATKIGKEIIEEVYRK